jgi:hypothetical protein
MARYLLTTGRIASVRRLALAIAIGSLLAVLPTSSLGASSASSTPLPPDFFGVTANGPLDAPGLDLQAEEGVMARYGVQSIRIAFDWGQIQPTTGKAPDFATMDHRIGAAAMNNIDALGLVLDSPGWAALKPGTPLSPPKNPATYATFVTQLIARYGPNGAFWKANPKIPPHPIRAWEVWNEPELSQKFPVNGAWQKPYVALLRAAHSAIKKADPGATVVLGGLTNFSWEDLASLYKAGAKGLFDVVSLHPYTRRPAGTVEISQKVRAVLNQNGNKGVPIWITELTWSSALGAKLFNKTGWVTTIHGQALRLTQAYADLIKARVSLNLTRVYWYTWASVDRNSPDAFDYSGLRTLGPNGTLIDKPAAASFRGVTAKYETH